MPDLKHYILTRFNLASPGRERRISSTGDWLGYRFQLFEKYCLPSVRDQTVQDFEWIIIFDRDTPAQYKKQIEELTRLFPFRIEYTTMYEMNKICPAIISTLPREKWLLTTRLDTDDVLAKDFVERLHSSLKWQGPEIFNFSNGLQLLLQERAPPKLYQIRDGKNPFASLLERFESPVKTIWWKLHVNIDQIAPVAQVDGRPAWMQVIHGRNISNRVKGRRIKLAAHVDNFLLLNSIRNTPEGEFGVAVENALLTPLRLVRESVWNLVKRLAKGFIFKRS